MKITSARIVDVFHENVLKRLEALDSLATFITSHAIATNQEFPFVTTPHFEMIGSNARIQSQSHIIHYMPVVNAHNRRAWEEYALEHREQVDEAHESDAQQIRWQDGALGYTKDDDDDDSDRGLQKTGPIDDSRNGFRNLTVFDDGTQYHPEIWSSGYLYPEGDFPDESPGPFLPLWQRRYAPKDSFCDLSTAVRSFAPHLFSDYCIIVT